MRYVLVFVLCIVSTQAFSQTTSKRFERIDSIARQVDSKSMDSLVYQLTKTCKSEEAKVRVIFVWIAEHVQYDVEALKRNRLIQGFSFFDKEDSIAKEILYISNRADTAFKKRKAVCEGYACLLKKMLDKTTVQSEIVHGFGRTNVHETNANSDSSNHAWNVVRLDGKWFLLDATWASGYVNTAKTKFTREYNDAYFLAKPKSFLHDHFPAIPRWQLLDTIISRDSFFNQVYTSAAFAQENIKSIRPHAATIQLSAKSPMLVVEIEHEDSSCFLSLAQLPVPNKKKNAMTDLRNDFLEKLNPRAEKFFRIEATVLPKTKTIDVLFNLRVVASYTIEWVLD